MRTTTKTFWNTIACAIVACCISCGDLDSANSTDTSADSEEGSATGWFTTGQSAELMLSGIDFNETGGALSFHHPGALASDGTRFLLCDRFNNRILVWNALPTSWDEEPDLVLGQADFHTNAEGNSLSGMNFPGAVSVGENGVVALADTENDRILVWLEFPTSNGEAADFAVDLSALAPAGSGTRYAWPWGVWTDGNRLIAAATQGGAILFWDQLPTAGESPDYTIALEEFGTPRTISTDGESYLMVGDHNCNGESGMTAPCTFVWRDFPTAENQEHDFALSGWIKGELLADGSFVASRLFDLAVWNALPENENDTPDLTVRDPMYSNGDGVDLAFAGGRLYLNNYNGNTVHVYDGIPSNSSERPDFALGTSDIDHNTLEDLHYIQNPRVAADDQFLIATSDYDQTIWIWTEWPEESGQDADVKIDTSDMGLIPAGNVLHGGVFVAAGDDTIAVWDEVPANGEAASRIFSGTLGSVTLSTIKAIALDDTYFYVGDETGKISVWQGLPQTGEESPVAEFNIPADSLVHLSSNGDYLVATSSNEHSVYVYRTSDLTGSDPQPYKTVSNDGGVRLNLPYAATLVEEGLAIANNSGNAVFLWQDIEDAGDPDTVVVLGQDSPEESEPGVGADGLYFPASLAYHDGTLWIGETKFSSRILKFVF